ncbi:MAG: hypothetical protein PHX25_01845 [Candidatus Pacebacteria bacterium]|nr:hypothetical protein [Candidatus Paceibacterota bacterium]
MQPKSICWIDGEKCIYHSHLTCLKDSPLESCSCCSRYEQNKEILVDLVEEYFDASFVSDEDMGAICSLLNIFKEHENILNESEKKMLQVILNKYA